MLGTLWVERAPACGRGAGVMDRGDGYVLVASGAAVLPALSTHARMHAPSSLTVHSPKQMYRTTSLPAARPRRPEPTARLLPAPRNAGCIVCHNLYLSRTVSATRLQVAALEPHTHAAQWCWITATTRCRSAPSAQLPVHSSPAQLAATQHRRCGHALCVATCAYGVCMQDGHSCSDGMLCALQQVIDSCTQHLMFQSKE